MAAVVPLWVRVTSFPRTSCAHLGWLVAWHPLPQVSVRTICLAPFASGFCQDSTLFSSDQLCLFGFHCWNRIFRKLAHCLMVNGSGGKHRTHLLSMMHHGSIRFTVHDEDLSSRHIVCRFAEQDSHAVCEITHIWQNLFVTWRRLRYEHGVTCHALVGILIGTSAKEQLAHRKSC